MINIFVPIPCKEEVEKYLNLWNSLPDYALADRIIRNTYCTLLSRGQKGCYIYCEDKELLKYISSILKIEIEG